MQSGRRGPLHSLNHFLTASDVQSFQLPKLRHKFLTSKTALKVDVIKLVLWENKIAFRGGKMASLVKTMADSDII